MFMLNPINELGQPAVQVSRAAYRKALNKTLNNALRAKHDRVSGQNHGLTIDFVSADSNFRQKIRTSCTKLRLIADVVSTLESINPYP